MHLQLIKQTSSGLLLPATPESGDFLQQIKIGEWIHADFKRVRNYALHKRFFKLLQLGFDYWTPTGGAIKPRERKLLSGFVDYLCESVGREHTPALSNAAEQYLNSIATRRTQDTALLKSFDAFREWVTVQAGFYTEHFIRTVAAGAGRNPSLLRTWTKPSFSRFINPYSTFCGTGSCSVNSPLRRKLKMWLRSCWSLLNGRFTKSGAGPVVSGENTLLLQPQSETSVLAHYPAGRYVQNSNKTS